MIIQEKARLYALKCHQDTNHLYDEKPYEVHLSMVVSVAREFYYMIDAKDRPIVIAACWCHDVIEDTRQTYNDVKNVCGEEIAEIVYALTNEKGKNRKERANDKYYEGIRNTKYASFVKACDRIANLYYSIKTNSSMAEKYKKEMPDFIKNVFNNGDESYKPIIDMLFYISGNNSDKCLNLPNLFQ